MTSSKQQTKEWFEQRLGKFTASQIYRLMDPEKRDEYVKLVASERLFGPQKKNMNFAMLWGHKYEPLARSLFEQETGLKVKEVPFIDSKDPELKGWFGASPDGIEESGAFGIEIKCLSKLKHKQISACQLVPPQYYWQICAQMLATKIPMWYFILYNPTTLPPLYYMAFDWADVSKDIEKVRSELIKAIADAKNLLYNWRKV